MPYKDRHCQRCGKLSRECICSPSPKEEFVDHRYKRVYCEICEQVIDADDFAHIEQHTPLELMTAWVKWAFLGDSEMSRFPYYLYDLRKILLTKCPELPDNILDIDVCLDWLVEHTEIPRDVWQ